MLESCVWQGDLPMELLCDGYQSIEQSKTYFGNLAPEYRDYSDREELCPGAPPPPSPDLIFEKCRPVLRTKRTLVYREGATVN